MIVFLLAHPDDEIAVFNKLEMTRKAGDRVLLIYLTSGYKASCTNSTRESESLKVLSKFGINADSVIFLGHRFQILDGLLVYNLEKTYGELIKILDTINISEIYFHAWEGGHEDHDATYLLGMSIAINFNKLNNSFQFPFYNGKNIVFGFKIFNPILLNGYTKDYKIKIIDRFKFVFYCLSYRSQWQTMIVLIPSLSFYYLFYGCQIIQSSNLFVGNSRPHSGLLLYERRNSFNFNCFHKVSISFIMRRIFLKNIKIE